MNKGDVQNVNFQTPREQGKEHVIEIWDRDVILSDDLLFTYKVPVDGEFVNGMIVAANPAEASSYLIYLTATLDRSAHAILKENHSAQINRALPT
jgi:hypothetical protein